MTYATEKQRMGRQPITVVELDLDYCSNVFGDGVSSPVTGVCTATGTPCYNTYKTCKDRTNFVKSTKTYRFCQPRSGLPIDQNLYPAISGKVKIAPTQITPGKGLGLRASVTVKIKDFTDTDIGIDPYLSTRTYDPLTQGTFWGRLMARNPYYHSRVMRVRTGYITTPWDWTNFESRTYFIEKIEGPIRKGNDVVFKVTGKDILKLLDDNRAKLPATSEGTYTGGLTDSPMTIGIAGDTDYDIPAAASPFVPNVVRIGKELYTYSGKTLPSPEDGSCTLTGITRQAWGSEQETPEVGDTVQKCLVYNASPVLTVLDNLLNEAGIDESYIPYDAGLTTPTGTNDEWDDEEDYWLSQTVTRVISKPTGFNDLITSLCDENQISIWWDEVDQKIKLKANAPPLANASVTSLNDDEHFLKNSVKVINDEAERITRVLTYYDKINQVEDGEKNYHVLDIVADANREGVNEYNDERTKEIKSEWFAAANAATVSAMANRTINRFGNTPKRAYFSLDAKDSSLWTGDLCDLTTRYIQNVNGADKGTRFQVVSVQESEQGHQYDYNALEVTYGQRNAYIHPTDSPTHTYATDTDAHKEAYAFIAQNDGTMPDGESGYTII